MPWTDIAPTRTIQDDGSPAVDHTHLQILAAAGEVRRQLDGVQVPSLDAMVGAMENHCQMGHAARTTHVARPLALSYLVRGRLDEGLRLVELARRAYLQSASDALARQPRGAQRDLDEVRRLERFTAWLPHARTD